MLSQILALRGHHTADRRQEGAEIPEYRPANRVSASIIAVRLKANEEWYRRVGRIIILVSGSEATA